MGPGARSSLLHHSFPLFYACYLLKSIKTPHATSTYIGSTPSPPRRIRQHNGELTAGASKTKNGRPWIMQMIVYGFPSKLAALQFEWAWQHPYISRHLKDEDGKAQFSKTYTLGTRIRALHGMIASNPYVTWPLHVKLFTEEAEKHWNATKGALPEGFTATVELEGVDGKSGVAGAGRTGPIDVKDELFTMAHLAKAAAISSSRRNLSCSICHEPITGFSANPLEVAICPSADSKCLTVSHLECLATDFLSNPASSSTSTSDLIPRGGSCRGCHKYVLWGDVIRGCYRRHKGGVATLEEDDEDEDDEDAMVDALEDNQDNSMDESEEPLQVKRKGKAVSSRVTAKAKATIVEVPKKPRGRPPKVPLAGKQALHTKVATRQTNPDDSSEGEFFDLDGITSGSDPEPAKTALGALPPMALAPATRLSVQEERSSSPPSRAFSEMSLCSDHEVIAPPPTIRTGKRGRREYVEVSD